MRVAGVMSGTSLDGVDVAVVDIEGRRIRTVAFKSRPFPKRMREAILAVSNATTTTAAISRLNFELGELYARRVLETCRGIEPPQLIGCHGQTIYHESGRNTLQIGEAAVIAERTGIPVISDFRVRDIAAGGTGAPLVPFLDRMLFPAGSVALNIGGIANVTDVRTGVAFDTGPGNMVIDALVKESTRGRLLFDRGGRLAARGQVDRRLLDELLEDPYYRQRPPKTAGREQFGQEFVVRLKRSRLPMPDLIATATVLTAASIAIGIRSFTAKANRLIISGGGAHNPRIVAHIAAFLPGCAIAKSSDYGVDVDAKEAIAFAVLAYQTWRRKPSNVPRATGARRAVILGKVSY